MTSLTLRLSALACAWHSFSPASCAQPPLLLHASSPLLLALSQPPSSLSHLLEHALPPGPAALSPLAALPLPRPSHVFPGPLRLFLSALPHFVQLRLLLQAVGTPMLEPMRKFSCCLEKRSIFRVIRGVFLMHCGKFFVPRILRILLRPLIDDFSRIHNTSIHIHLATFGCPFLQVQLALNGYEATASKNSMYFQASELIFL